MVLCSSVSDFFVTDNIEKNNALLFLTHHVYDYVKCVSVQHNRLV